MRIPGENVHLGNRPHPENHSRERCSETRFWARVHLHLHSFFATSHKGSRTATKIGIWEAPQQMGFLACKNWPFWAFFFRHQPGFLFCCFWLLLLTWSTLTFGGFQDYVAEAPKTVCKLEFRSFTFSRLLAPVHLRFSNTCCSAYKLVSSFRYIYTHIHTCLMPEGYFLYHLLGFWKFIFCTAVFQKSYCFSSHQQNES